MDSRRLRAVILKIQDYLSNDDRKRLHFFLGDDIPRLIQDDPTLGGTLDLIQHLFDKDKINEENFTFLINAFDEIQCFDAVRILREHKRRMQTAGQNESMQSLISILIQDTEDENTCATHNTNLLQLNRLATHESDTNKIIDNTADINLESMTVDRNSCTPNRKGPLKLSKITMSIRLVFVILLTLVLFLGGFILIFKVKGFLGTIEPKNISGSTNWKQLGSIVVGRNGQGHRLDQLHYPVGIYIDNNEQTIYVSDAYNHRIIAWKSDMTSGQVTAGGNGEGQRIDQLNHPTNIVFDQTNNSLVICDSGNERVMRWFRSSVMSPQVIITEIQCDGLAIDNNGDLYVTNWKKFEIQRWKEGETNGITVAGGNGNGTNLNQFSDPSFIFVDKDYSIYVSDFQNHRVMKWLKGAKEGIVVAGGNGQGNRLNQLSHPQGLFIDHFGNVYVVDCWNHRILRWLKDAHEGSIIVGKHNQLNYPVGIAFDRQGNLYVVNQKSNQVLKFDVDIY